MAEVISFLVLARSLFLGDSSIDGRHDDTNENLKPPGNNTFIFVFLQLHKQGMATAIYMSCILFLVLASGD